MEGKKHWKVYEPIDDDEILPRESSGALELRYLSRYYRTIGNLTAAEMHGRQIAWEGCVNAGDLLYVPRGFIHQVHRSVCHACFTMFLVGEGRPNISLDAHHYIGMSEEQLRRLAGEDSARSSAKLYFVRFGVSSITSVRIPQLYGRR